MRLAWAWLFVGALVASASPVASANAAFSAESVSVLGDASIDAPFAALFVLLGDGGLDWQATAASVEVHRKYANYTSVYAAPLDPDTNAYTNYEPGRETLVFDAGTLQSTATRAGGAFLVLAQGDAAVAATTEQLAAITSSHNPAFRQSERAQVQGEDTQYEIRETLSGTYLNVTATGGAFEIRGDIALQLTEIDYRVADDSRAHDGVTGTKDAWDLSVARSGRVELDTIILRDAVLLVNVPGESRLYTHDALMSFDGEIRADAGASEAVGTAPTAQSGDFMLAATGAGVTASAAPAAAAAIRAVSPDAPGLPYAAVGLALLALTFALVLWARHRERPDPVEAAVLAMGERRWTDALPHLDRALAKRPADVGLLVDRALCLEQSGRLSDARDTYERALGHAPAHAEAHFYYARTLARLHDRARSRAHLDRALLLDPRLTELARGEPMLRALGDHPLRDF